MNETTYCLLCDAERRSGKKNNRVHVVPCVSIVIKKQKEKEMGSKHREKEPRKEGRGLRFWVNSRSRNHSW